MLRAGTAGVGLQLKCISEIPARGPPRSFLMNQHGSPPPTLRKCGARPQLAEEGALQQTMEEQQHECPRGRAQESHKTGRPGPVTLPEESQHPQADDRAADPYKQRC